MTSTGNSWAASISLESGRTPINLATTHTVPVDSKTIPISALHPGDT